MKPFLKSIVVGATPVLLVGAAIQESSPHVIAQETSTAPATAPTTLPATQPAIIRMHGLRG